AIALALYGAYRGAVLVLSADALQVTRITVSGNARMSKGEVVALLDGLRGQSMITADLESWRRRLLTAPWVGNAAIRRVLPGTIAVAIAERQPMGIGRLGDDLYLIDQRGTIIDQFGPHHAEIDLPIIDGLAAPPRDGGPLIDEERAALAARLLASLHGRPDLAKRVSQVDVTDVTDASVVLEDDPAIVRLGDDEFVERLQCYTDLAAALRERVNEIDYVDLRFDDRIYVKPRGAGSRGPGASVRRPGRKAGS
ncbi:MAG: cell division protein FtsQ/DivIB, partial [Vicinamibacterales bacterium]